MSTEKKLEEYIKSMPSLPTSLIKILEVCDHPQTSPADLNNIISLDPVLVGRVLKLINSAYCGLGKSVKNLTRAIIMLGVNTVKNLALSTTIIALFPGKLSPGLDMEAFWRHSLCVGAAAKILARKRGINPYLTEEYFTAGLLHDIGKIPLNTIFSNEYLMAIDVADREQKPQLEAETKTLGLNHCSAGAMIALSWKLGGALKDTIEYHHNRDEYTGDYKDILYSVAIANRFASNSGRGYFGSHYAKPLSPSVWETLNISSNILNEIEASVSSEIEKAEIFLKIGLSKE